MTTKPTTPDSSAEWWTTSDVAAYLGLQIATVSKYRERGQMPKPDMTVGRTHMWRPTRIIEWHQKRPRPGVGGRPVGAADDVGQSSLSARKADADRESDDTRWLVHGKRNLYSSEWIRLDLTDVELPDGQRFEHHTVWMPPAAMTAVLDDSGTCVLLLWRHRFVPDIWNWELPGGLIDEGESAEQTAAREIEEETGYRVRRLEYLVTFEPMIGMVNCPHHIFIGHGAEHIGSPVETTEMQRMEWIPLTEVPKLIGDGLVRNSGSLVALLHVLALSGPTARTTHQ